MNNLITDDPKSKSKTVYEENQKLRIQTVFGQNNNNNPKNREDYLVELRKSKRKDNLDNFRTLD